MAGFETRLVAPLGGLRAMAAGRLLFGILFALALAPVLVTPIPAMVDYVNHLARMYLLVGSDAAPSPFYKVAWTLTPNLAMDLVIPWMARLVGVELAARLFLLASQILVVTGAMAIEQAVKGRQQLGGFAGLLLLSSAPFAWGFVNFEFALGLALWGIAAWIAWRARPWPVRLATHAAVCALLFVSHLFAFGLYGVSLGVHELWRATRGQGAVRALVPTGVLLAAPALVFAGLMLGAGGSVGQSGYAWHLAMKPLWPFALLNGYSVTLSMVGMLVLLALVHALAKRRALAFESSGAWLATGLGLLYLAVPSDLLGTALVDVRVIVAGLLIVPAFVTVSFPDARWRTGASAAVAALIVANIAVTASVWTAYQPQYRAMIASFARIEPGARVLVGHSGAVEMDPPFQDLAEYPIYHAPTLAVAYAGAFVPTLFTTSGKQPIAVRAAYARLSDSCGGPVPTALLAAIAAGRKPEDTPDFIRSWTHDFDYLYVVGPPEPNPMPDRLEPMETHPRFTLYRIRKEARIREDARIRRDDRLMSPPPAGG